MNQGNVLSKKNNSATLINDRYERIYYEIKSRLFLLITLIRNREISRYDVIYTRGRQQCDLRFIVAQPSVATNDHSTFYLPAIHMNQRSEVT